MESHKIDFIDASTTPRLINRKAYQEPLLIPLGDLRSLTLGGSKGGHETVGRYKPGLVAPSLVSPSDSTSSTPENPFLP